MSEALPLSERIAARLERLAERDLAAAEHVHDQLMATTEPRETAELARAYQRASRTLRQTLMLQMKHAREQAEAARPPAPRSPIVDEATHAWLIESRIRNLQDAVGRVAAAAHPDSPRLQREALDRLDVELDVWIRDEDFVLEYLDDQVVDACERLGLPVALAEQWKDIPRPGATFDPATASPPLTDTG